MAVSTSSILIVAFEYVLLQKELGSLEIWLIPLLDQRKYKINLESMHVPESKESQARRHRSQFQEASTGQVDNHMIIIKKKIKHANHLIRPSIYIYINKYV